MNITKENDLRSLILDEVRNLLYLVADGDNKEAIKIIRQIAYKVLPDYNPLLDEVK